MYCSTHIMIIQFSTWPTLKLRAINQNKHTTSSPLSHNPFDISNQEHIHVISFLLFMVKFRHTFLLEIILTKLPSHLIYHTTSYGLYIPTFDIHESFSHHPLFEYTTHSYTSSPTEILIHKTFTRPQFTTHQMIMQNLTK